jgi:monofunctional glycosyltransferase
MGYSCAMVRPGKRFSKFLRLLRAAVFAVLALLALPYLIVPFYAFGKPVSTVMVWRSLTGAHMQRNFVPLASISPALALAVIVAEDGRFCSHHGVDFTEIRDALADADDLADVRGGSTITQQVAKNLFLWQGRSWLRKALEFPLALWIDLVLSKRRILEIYLNIAEWGPNGEFGVEAGSRNAFGKPARDLSHYQAALLAAVLPNPMTRNAHAPGPGLRRLAGLYVGRSARAGAAVACIRTP